MFISFCKFFRVILVQWSKLEFNSDRLLAIARIGFALSFFVFYLSLFGNSEIETLFLSSKLGLFSFFSTAKILWVSFSLLIVFTAFTMFGFFTRISIVGMTVLHLLFIKSNPNVFGGWAAIVFHFSWLFFFIDCARALSLDAYFFKKDKTKNDGYYFLYLCILAQISLVYLIANYFRLTDSVWILGTFPYYFLKDPFYSRFANYNWEDKIVLIQVVHYLFWIVEMIGVFLWFLKPQKNIIFLLILLHFSLLIVSTIPSWQILMIFVLPLFLLKKSESLRIQSSLKLKVIVFILFISFFVTSVLVIEKPKIPFISNVYNILSYVKLDKTLNMTLFSSHSKFNERCIAVFGFEKKQDAIKKALFHSNILECTGVNNRFSTTGLEIFLRRQITNTLNKNPISKSFKKMCSLWPDENYIQIVQFTSKNEIQSMSPVLLKNNLFVIETDVVDCRDLTIYPRSEFYFPNEISTIEGMDLRWQNYLDKFYRQRKYKYL